ncbi:hypothetical protein NliqN6_3385 [Naganishia liquefaciens]|uniref:Uncharacterized protein n=1 Tax=Naganishia liquefaciens TaxID=104408 RepID=A0A8H3TTT5_9TREE|nr:hypothetical protein NliqN6_3385 [Naganishia liquefaciens]
MREAACDVLREQLEHQQRITTYLADVQASTEATLGQRELDLQLKQDQFESAFAKLEAKEKDLTAREEKVARQAAELAATLMEAKPATVLAMNTTCTRSALDAARAVKASGAQPSGIGAASASATRAIQRVGASKQPAPSDCTVVAARTQSLKERLPLTRERPMARKDAQSRQQASTTSVAVTATQTRSAEAGKQELQLPGKSTPYPRPRTEIAARSAVVSRSTTAGRVVPGVKSPETSAFKAAPSAGGTGSAAKASLPVRGERTAIATGTAKPPSQEMPLARRAPRTTQAIMANADAVMTRRAQQHRLENATETKPVSGAIARPRAIIRSMGDIRAKDNADVKVGHTDIMSSARHVQAKNLTGVPRIAKPIHENGIKRAFREAFTDTQACSTSVAPKRARPSLIPVSTRLHSRFLPRAVAIAAC